MVRNLILINVVIFLIQFMLLDADRQRWVTDFFSLHYISVTFEYRFWQVFTYMFLHGSLTHIIFNMLSLYFIGTEIENFLGSKAFLKYYLLTGLGAGLVILGWDSLKVFSGGPVALGSTVGASGAIFALVLLYSSLFADRQVSILLFFIIPVTVRAKNLLLISLGLSFLLPLFTSARISHSGHIGGVLSGILVLFLLRRTHEFRATYNAYRTWYKGLLQAIKPKTRHRISRSLNQFGQKFDQKFTHNSKQNLDEKSMSDLEIENKIDELLDIIAIKGLKGLSEEEKKFLERVSYLYRHKFPN